jgi:hypothetical protein
MVKCVSSSTRAPFAESMPVTLMAPDASVQLKANLGLPDDCEDDVRSQLYRKLTPELVL